MKKQYSEPRMEVIVMTCQGMLAHSFGDPATEPAHSRETDDLYEDF